jgi:hypothetical protein
MDRVVLRTPRLELRLGPDDWSLHFMVRFEGLEPCLPVLGL